MFEAYKAAVRLSLVSNVGSGLAVLSHQFAKLNGDTKRAQSSIADLEKSLNNIKRLGLVGGAMAGVGFGALSLFRAPLEQAKEFQTEMARFNVLGLGDKTNAEAAKFATGMSIIGQSSLDNMKMLREATAMIGDFEHAKQVLPLLGRMKFGIDSVMGEGSGSDFEHMFQAAIKTTELRGALVNKTTGLIDTARFSGALNMMTQAYVASAGLVKPQDYLQALKTGGVSTKLMSDEMFMFGLGHFMQESGGSRVGTASMSMFQNWAMGRMSQQVAERMAAHGMLDKSAIHYGTTGHITKVDPMGMIRAQEFIENPFRYANNVIVPMLQKEGLSGNALNIELASMLGIRTAANLVDQFVREEKVADLYIARAHKAAGIDGLAKEGEQSMNGQLIILQKKWDDVLRELGTTVLPIAIKAVEGLNAGLSKMLEFAQKHPMLTEAALLIGGATAATAALGGVALLATSGIKALTLATGVLPGNLAIATTAIKGLGAASVAAFGVLDAIRAVQTGESASYDAVNIIGAALTGDKNFDLGAFIYDKTHPNGSGDAPANGALPLLSTVIKNAQASPVPNHLQLVPPGTKWELQDSSKSRYIATKSERPIEVTVVSKLNEREVARSVINVAAREASRPVGGVSGFDSTMSPPPVGFPR